MSHMDFFYIVLLICSVIKFLMNESRLIGIANWNKFSVLDLFR